jgi:hypothetical protein
MQKSRAFGAVRLPRLPRSAPLTRAARSKAAPVLALLVLAASLVVGLAQADDRPLKGWMKKNMGAPRESGDFAALEAAFVKVSLDVPDPSWSDWASLSKQGAAAAKAKDMAGVKASCSGCHHQYKHEYKEKYASRPAPK